MSEITRRSFFKLGKRFVEGAIVASLPGDSSSQSGRESASVSESDPTIEEATLSLAQYARHRHLTISNFCEQRLRISGKSLDTLLSPQLPILKFTSIGINVNGFENPQIAGKPQLSTSYWSFDNRLKKKPIPLKSGQTVEQLVPSPGLEIFQNLSVTFYSSVPIAPENHFREYFNFPVELKSKALKLLKNNPYGMLSVIAITEIWGLIGLSMPGQETTTIDRFSMAISQLEQGIQLFSLGSPDSAPSPVPPSSPMPEYSQT